MSTALSDEPSPRYWSEEPAGRPNRRRIRARIAALHCSLCTGAIEKVPVVTPTRANGAACLCIARRVAHHQHPRRIEGMPVRAATALDEPMVRDRHHKGA